MKNDVDYIEEALKLILKISVWAAPSLAGWLAHLGYKWASGKKITVKYFFGSAILALFVGYIVFVVVDIHAPKYSVIWAMFAALISKEIIFAVMRFGWQQVVNKVLAVSIRTLLHNLSSYIADKTKPKE